MQRRTEGGRLRRLALYLHAALNTDRKAITSEELGAAARVHSSHVRRDLTRVAGPTGSRGVGYSPERLAAALRQELEPNVDALRAEADIARAQADALAEVVTQFERSSG